MKIAVSESSFNLNSRRGKTIIVRPKKQIILQYKIKQKFVEGNSGRNMQNTYKKI